MNTEERERIIPHLLYEFSMLEHTSRYLYRHPVPDDGQLDICQMTDDQVARLAVLESFLVHVRLVKDFLFGSKRHPQAGRKPRYRDVRASQFMEDPRGWPPAGVFFSLQLQEAIDYSNRHLMHLDQERSEVNLMWHHERILQELITLRHEFMKRSKVPLCQDLEA